MLCNEYEECVLCIIVHFSSPNDYFSSFILIYQAAGNFAEDPGYWVVLLNELAERAGFSFSWGVLEISLVNYTADELLEWTVNAYDFSFSEWDSTVERMKLGVDFPAGKITNKDLFISARNHTV